MEGWVTQERRRLAGARNLLPRWLGSEPHCLAGQALPLPQPTLVDHCEDIGLFWARSAQYPSILDPPNVLCTNDLCPRPRRARPNTVITIPVTQERRRLAGLPPSEPSTLHPQDSKTAPTPLPRWSAL